jgi:hypothetical protein
VVAVDVELVSDIFTDRQKQDIVTRVADTLEAIGGIRPAGIKWVVIARADRASRTAAPDEVGRTPPATRGAFALDYPTWHARLAGSSRRPATGVQPPAR